VRRAHLGEGSRLTGGGAGAAPKYDTIGRGYSAYRRPDPRWVAAVDDALGDAQRILNVGAGAGSYEPGAPRQVVAVEPSTVMLEQRSLGAAPAVRASGSALPIRTDGFDVALAVLTLHHWDDWRTGLSELARVAPRRVILSLDFEVHSRFWLLTDYLPQVADVERHLRPSPADIAAVLPVVESIDLPLPPDLSDGVLGAFWRHPEAHLDPALRATTSPLALADPSHVALGMQRLEDDLASGAWRERYGHLLELDELDLGYRLLVSEHP
jgi:SAM-dependent methyltransferase